MAHTGASSVTTSSGRLSEWRNPLMRTVNSQIASNPSAARLCQPVGEKEKSIIISFLASIQQDVSK